ncbi:MAG: ribonucrease [Pseudonocardiales bacterium]|nr:ribonucrease [Pseudonocardiales bacterium]
MQGVWYAAVGAAFLLGVLFLVLRRGPAAPGRHAVESAADVDALADSARRVAEAEASSIRQVAQAEAEALRREMASESARLAEQSERTERELATATARLESTESRLDAQAARLDTDGLELDRAIANLAEQRRDVEAVRADLDGQRRLIAARAAELERRDAELETRTAEHVRELERVAGLSAEQARAELLTSVEVSARRDAALLVRTIENEARTEGTERARNIVVEAVQRVASEQTTETVVSVLHLPGDDMKGRIIGREGRNIRAFESVTGVNVIIDDTPEAVLLSCFDPVRREIGRLTLERLVLDGRIHPQRIEDVYEQSKADIDELCLRAARDALVEVGIGDVDDRLLPTLGRLKYRTSYGQNVLGHLVETAHIAGIMAAELGIEPTLVKRCAFLHDIGKALTHEVEGSHAIIGADLLRRHGESEAVAHAVEAHHNEVAPQTVEAVLTQASDTCSAARPGARRESLENYVKRLARIEEIATSRPGVEKVFAMQSGREVRVMVQPAEIDDLAASVIAREIAKQIEDELTYPGQIRVTVVRESRTTEIAH